MNEIMQNLLRLQAVEFGETKEDGGAKLIAELRGKIPSQILAHYDRLRTRGKKGLVALRNQVCTGCHMRQTLAVVMTLKQDLDIQLCGSCGRYLYLPPEVEGAPPGDKAEPKPVPKPRQRGKSSGRARA